MNMKTNQPPASEAIAAKVDEAIARGEDPLGDDEPLEVVADDDDVDDAGSEETEAAATGGADAGDGAAEPGDQAKQNETSAAASEAAAEALNADALAAVAADEPEIIPLRVDDTDFAAKRKELSDKEDSIESRWAAGELSDADRSKELRTLRNDLNELTRQETRAETIAEMNRQQMENYQVRVLRDLSTRSKAAGQLDYGDAKVSAAFDGMLRAVASDPANEGKKFHELTQLAHEALCATRGVKAVAASAAAAPAAAPAVRKSPAAPITLRDLPVASTPNTGGDALDALGKLEGQAYQEAYNRLSPAQQARLLDEA